MILDKSNIGVVIQNCNTYVGFDLGQPKRKFPSEFADDRFPAQHAEERS